MQFDEHAKEVLREEDTFSLFLLFLLLLLLLVLTGRLNNILSSTLT
jgi:hypothetical protein